ncbi:alkaline phosphatase D family protein [Hirschia baltica]|uniref:Alkaline phosphatase n=1 Tax=Hirschia baltica (strain ATCC 49814 / DSM 5838 / IFAM 1418) TaxID=582402 RepID=C6XQP8_HIRBI|nr:alkaline phosphatase D family protein [Hirschia baltica]ACT58654.1 Alkaline phosphatase [Hirschia baltica ATCC 49814]
MRDISRRRFFYFGAASSALAAGCATQATGPLGQAEKSVTAFDGEASFSHGVAAGDATSDAVILWSRISPIADNGPIQGMVFISTEASDIENLSQLEKGSLTTLPTQRSVVFSTNKDRDYTIKIDVKALKPATQYYYAFAVETVSGVVVSPMGRAKTLPKTGTAPFKAAVVSCSNFPFGFFNVYDAIAKRDDVDAVIHLGDYLYEYGSDGYGSEVGAKIGRIVEPAHEIISLDDYRKRHAQYKADENLQKAHARAVWYCSWDDHESANDSYRTGAQNHQEETEGPWSTRKTQAIQAYLEWMPVRDPDAGKALGSIYRGFDIGDLASLFMLESRLLARSIPLSFGDAMAVPEDQRMAKVQEIIAETMNPERSMLGDVQENWLAAEFKRSVSEGKKWQVLGNQVIMAKVKTPNVAAVLSDEQKKAIYAKAPYAEQYIEFSKFGLTWNMDAWDGYVAARERLYASAKSANARLVTLTGDTHTAWANDLHDKDGELRGVEFGCTSVTSAGLGDIMPIPQINALMEEKNDEVRFFDAFGRGYTMLSLSKDAVDAEFVKVSDVYTPEYTVETVKSMRSTAQDSSMSKLTSL